jgi:hypothetical protein
MEITVYRDQPLAREQRTLPAAVYNLARTLQARSPRGVAFVPIRAMQVLVILDREEFVFLDSQYKSWVEIAWQGFRTSLRQALDEPVHYTAVYYQPDGAEVMKRLQSEFAKALQALAYKARVDGPARVLNLTARRAGPAPV